LLDSTTSSAGLSKKIKLVRNEQKLGLRTNFPKWREATNQIIYNISFYQNNIIIKVFNYFWYRPLFVSAIYIKTVNTEQRSIYNDLQREADKYQFIICILQTRCYTQRFYVTRRMSTFIHEIYSIYICLLYSVTI
jgi:hypothetical protein